MAITPKRYQTNRPKNRYIANLFFLFHAIFFFFPLLLLVWLFYYSNTRCIHIFSLFIYTFNRLHCSLIQVVESGMAYTHPYKQPVGNVLCITNEPQCHCSTDVLKQKGKFFVSTSYQSYNSSLQPITREILMNLITFH